MNEIDKFYAEKCGVLTHSAQTPLGCGTTSTSHSFFIKDGQKQHYYKWTIGDARCREIIREVFKIDTLSIHDDRGARWAATILPRQLVFRGKTIREAEIALLQDIFEQENK